eukprot:TRINITY_DN10166_c0_g1_i1.p1 TRINITY_DN10166_c0_g1~~TRINITY_DN10166_c0_g1_i1.p1  ORF type:complete len:321 (+),score=57.92 TRINITY_DN10166_c0_g1_i1:193-1155(+)
MLSKATAASVTALLVVGALVVVFSPHQGASQAGAADGIVSSTKLSASLQPTEGHAPLFPIYQGTDQKGAIELMGSSYAADLIHAKMKAAGLACTLPPEVLLNSGTYEGLIFGSQILASAPTDSRLHHVGLGVRNFAHGMTRLVQLNLQAPCSKQQDPNFNLPCNPAASSCDSSLSATQQLVQNVLPQQNSASQFEVVPNPLGEGTQLPLLNEKHYSATDSNGNMNFQGAQIASGGLTHRNPTPFPNDSGSFSQMASIMNEVLSMSAQVSLPDGTDSVPFYEGFYSTTSGIRNWFACFAPEPSSFGQCFSKGGQGVFTSRR